MNRIVFIGREGCDYSRQYITILKKFQKKYLLKAILKN